MLSVSNVTKLMNGLPLYQKVNFQINPGEKVGLVGANGSGKSTLAYIVMGCEGYVPDGGQIRFEGADIGSLKIHERAHRGIALAWQEPARFEGLRVNQYLTFKDPHADPSVSLKAVGLSHEIYGKRFVDKTLSGGERKRIELASILALKPRLAILDEPASVAGCGKRPVRHAQSGHRHPSQGGGK